MGEAKKRGTYQERVTQAIEREKMKEQSSEVSAGFGRRSSLVLAMAMAMATAATINREMYIMRDKP